MSMTDPISDFLARIRNGIVRASARSTARARASSCASPRSWRDEGYIDGVATRRTPTRAGSP